MTAEEIRKRSETLSVDTVGVGPLELQRIIALASVRAKLEIAAQLAELNQRAELVLIELQTANQR